MAIDYARIAKQALKQIENAGMPVTLHIPGTGGGYIPGAGVVPDTPPTNHDGTGALLGYEAKYVDGKTIQHGDQKLILAPQIGAEPKAGHALTAAGVTYNVVGAERVAPAGVVVLYKLQLRGV